ncbi:c-type cytochrome [Thiobacillus sp.]|uniref:c-type cytochrome n=1 Tax=Thiobacillus sp. TaxID=924 RepID=UPI0025FED990|nr:c-type cytochrome [Thiobacillus sp.]
MKLSLLAALAMGLVAAPAIAADSVGAGILKSQCISCHAIVKPDNTSLDRLWERKGPDLYYAGSKFNRPWLEKWLQNPVRIRPAGELYTKHIKGGDKEDVVDESTMASHMKLSKADAEAAAEALMALTGPADLVSKGAFKGEKVSMSMGAMFFNKLRGCAACHQAKPGTGGSSGPELYTAGERLQPDYIYSYIKNPQAIDPHIWMPTLNLAEPDLQRLTGYILQLSASEGK